MNKRQKNKLVKKILKEHYRIKKFFGSSFSGLGLSMLRPNYPRTIGMRVEHIYNDEKAPR